jgi:simple sugar transport system ATP-binding protein
LSLILKQKVVFRMRLQLKQVSKTFGALRANHDISLSFAASQIYAILGENGAGKSTLMKIIAGYQAPDAGGHIYIEGEAVVFKSPMDALAKGVGMLYQDPLDFPPMTVLDNYLTARPDVPFIPKRRQAAQELAALCTKLGFSLNPQALVESLTIGERQQLEIARLLSLNIKILILDEPTTGISAEQRQRLFSALKRLAQEEGLTILLVTHKLADVEALCDKVVVLRAGRVVGQVDMPSPSAYLVKLMFGTMPSPPSREAVPLGETVLAVENLHLHTPLFTLPSLSLEVRAGEVLGLAGLDGSGQTEFMRACAGFTRLSWGRHMLALSTLALCAAIFSQILGDSRLVLGVTLALLVALLLVPLVLALLRYLLHPHDPIRFLGAGTRWLGYRELRARGLAYLSAGRLEEGLVRGLTLTQHSALADPHPRPWVAWRGALRRMEAAIARYQIRGKPHSPIHTLSGGNQQRVALSLLPPALRLAFLENPTRGLDVNSAQRIWDLLLERRKDGTALIFSSPDLDEIVRYSDRILVFSSGKWRLVTERAEMNAETLGLLIGGADL